MSKRSNSGKVASETTLVDIKRLAIAVDVRRGERTYVAAAREAGIPWYTLRRVARGESIPELDTFLKLCRWIGKDATYFINAERNAA